MAVRYHQLTAAAAKIQMRTMVQLFNLLFTNCLPVVAATATATASISLNLSNNSINVRLGIMNALQLKAMNNRICQTVKHVPIECCHSSSVAQFLQKTEKVLSKNVDKTAIVHLCSHDRYLTLSVSFKSPVANHLTLYNNKLQHQYCTTSNFPGSTLKFAIVEDL